MSYWMSYMRQKGSPNYIVDLDIWVAIRDEYKPAFKTHHDLSEFKVMPLGLTNSLASFQGPINSILLPY